MQLKPGSLLWPEPETHASDATDPTIRIRTDGFLLEAEVWIPPDPVGMAVFAAGASLVTLKRFTEIALHLRTLGYATSVVELLTDVEEQLSGEGNAAQSMPCLLSSRLQHVLSEIGKIKATKGLPIVLICSGVLAATAVSLATNVHQGPKALVLVDGRIDLVKSDLRSLTTPTLFVVNRSDEMLVDINVQGFANVHHATKAMIEVGDCKSDWRDAVDEIGAWACQFADLSNHAADVIGGS